MFKKQMLEAKCRGWEGRDICRVRQHVTVHVYGSPSNHMHQMLLVVLGIEPQGLVPHRQVSCHPAMPLAPWDLFLVARIF